MLPSIDLWAAGMMVAEIAIGEPFASYDGFFQTTNFEIRKAMTLNKIDKEMKGGSVFKEGIFKGAVQTIVGELLNVDEPAQRPSAQYCLQLLDEQCKVI